jgi:PAS domain S-box-containing protein
MEYIVVFGFVVIIILMAGWRHYSILSINKNLLKTREQLKQSEYFSKTVIETEPECVKIIDAEGNLIFMNRAGLDMIEAESLEQVKGGCVCPLVTSEYRDAFMKLVREVCSGGSGTFTFEMVGLKGRRLWLETRAVPFRNEKDEITALLGITRDITEKKKAEEAIAAEKERLAVTLRSIGDGVIVTDIDGNITLINKVSEQLTGWTLEDALGRPLTEVFNIINETTKEKCENPVEKVLKSGKIVGLANHTALIQKGGTEIIIADSAAPINDTQSRTIGIVLVFRDITAQYRMEQEMQKIQKLESLGLLAGGLAHDFNNLLTSILGNVSLVKMQLGVEHRSFARLIDAEKAAKMAADLTQQLLTFSKGGAPVKKPASLIEIVRDACTFALSGSNVKCFHTVPASLWSVEVDKSQISQVFNNLIINAIHAMPNGGAVHVAFENVTVQENNAASLKRGDYVKITFRDEGTGIPEGNLSKIFEPYFTSKEGGTGLGLATVLSIINRHEGAISVESRVGAGTAFTLYIPALRDMFSAATEEVRSVQKGHGRILVMDDEELVRNVAGYILNDLGYVVAYARDGEEAIEAYLKAAREQNPFDVVIMDLTIPGGMGGKDAVIASQEHLHGQGHHHASKRRAHASKQVVWCVQTPPALEDARPAGTQLKTHVGGLNNRFRSGVLEGEVPVDRLPLDRERAVDIQRHGRGDAAENVRRGNAERVRSGQCEAEETQRPGKRKRGVNLQAMNRSGVDRPAGEGCCARLPQRSQHS